MTASSTLLLILACLCAFVLTPAAVSGQSIVHYYSDAGCVTSYDWFELPVNRCSRADESRPYLIVTCRDDWSDWSVEAYQPADGLCLGDLDASFQGANSDACVRSSFGQNVWVKVSCSDAALTYTVSGFVMIALAWIAVKMQL